MSKISQNNVSSAATGFCTYKICQSGLKGILSLTLPKMCPVLQHINLFFPELLCQLQGIDDFIVLFIAAVGSHAQG